MTSQEEPTIDALKAEAKELNVVGWQACKDPEKLQAKIDEAKKGTGRSKAPKMTVLAGAGNNREAILKGLMKDDPESQYLTQSSRLTASEAQAKGFEIVRKADGEIMYCGSDIVVRTDKEYFDKVQDDIRADSLRAMKSIDKTLTTDGGGQMIQSVTEKPKQGIEPA